MEPLLTSSQSRAADAYTIEELGLSELVLMEHAALAVVHALKRRFGRLAFRKSRGVCVAGPGNNGGDAIAVARLLKSRGVDVSIACVWSSTTVSLATQTQKKIAQRLGIPIYQDLTDEMLESTDWIVDGIFGTGLSRPPEGNLLSVIEKINSVSDRKWIVAIDVPSGLSSDTGAPLGNAVAASETVALGSIKRGLVTGFAADCVGQLSLSRIEIPRNIPGIVAQDYLFGREDVRLPLRSETGHKGLYGHVFVWAGEPAKAGAATFSALSALRTGAGLVSLVGPADRVATMRAHLPPEVLVETLCADQLVNLSEPVIAMGPGMGLSEASALKCALQSACDVVLDADALTLLSQDKTLAALIRERDANTVLTPHPKEAARLLGETTEAVQADRFRAVSEIARRYDAWVVLKGKGSLLCGPSDCDRRLVVNNGTSGLSKGGTGDVLTGVIASLLAQGVEPGAALPLGTFLLGEAAQWYGQKYGDERSVLPSELTQIIPIVLAEMARGAR